MAGAAAAQANPTLPGPVLPQSPVPANPQAALAQMVQQALPRQDSVVGLTTALGAAIGKFALPEPVAKAAQQVLAARVSLDGGQVSGDSLKTAVLKSGIFQEALLASGKGTLAAGDTKSALLGLRQSLGAWLGQQAPVAQVAGVAPPLRGLLPRARSADGGAPALPDDMLEVGRMLLERSEAALSRVRLHQSASLPEQSAARQDAQWSLDLPVVVAGQQHLLQMQIHKDPEGENERPEDRGWQIRFAINLSDAGEIGAQISLRAGSAGVLLWAERPETSAALSADVEALKVDLAALGLKPGAVVIRTGAPAPPAGSAPSASGQHLDATR
ncbi:MAG: flagellar hook-length control protein FliK [Parvibaculum sp.]|uniref:flagellar hook-length control protein FliK n=1 Tax=Parvibaculum sp. TaxID=2024848 RepID=UPI0032ED07A9